MLSHNALLPQHLPWQNIRPLTETTDQASIMPSDQIAQSFTPDESAAAEFHPRAQLLLRQTANIYHYTRKI